jgi:hypothetical protein
MDMESNLRGKIDKNENEIKKANLCIIENVILLGKEAYPI